MTTTIKINGKTLTTAQTKALLNRTSKPQSNRIIPALFALAALAGSFAIFATLIH